jgi:hypothetical protein
MGRGGKAKRGVHVRSKIPVFPDHMTPRSPDPIPGFRVSQILGYQDSQIYASHFSSSHIAEFTDLLLVGSHRGVHQGFISLSCTLQPYPTPRCFVSQAVAPYPQARLPRLTDLPAAIISTAKSYP